MTLLLIFTIFTDFTSASFHNEVLNACESQIGCVDVDLHSSNDGHNNEADDCHDHCHLGHSHNVIVSSYVVKSKPILSKLYISYPAFQVGKAQNYFIDIIRPPIA